MSTPYKKDTYAAIVAAARARSMRPGFYVCPSFWNNDNYWAPSAISATEGAGCCQPNYQPLKNASTTSLWSNFVQYLQGEVTELANKYNPTHAWFDSGSYPPAVDTRLEQMAPTLRAANPEAVFQVRDGGIWHDYVESVDHSETDAHALLGMSYFKIGDPWEVPGTLGEQWAYDPNAVYKDASTVIRELIGVVAKGGNFLLNIGLDPTGVWAPAAVTTLNNMSSWMAYNSEAIFNTTVVFP
jgi:alpha-L-fucosidase